MPVNCRRKQIIWRPGQYCDISMSMITAIAWVPRGCAATYPTKYVVDDHELARIARLAKLKLDDANEDLENAGRDKKEDRKAVDSTDEDGNNGTKVSQSNG